MPITFEEITADVEREPRAGERSAPPAPEPAARAEDLREQFERDLRLREQRLARLSAD